MILLDTIELKKTKRRPVWFMRQAGRYQASFRKLRETYSFEDLCLNSDLGLQVSLLPLKEFELDAAIVFSDILFPLRALGARLEFTDQGPVLESPKSAADLKRLRTSFDPVADTSAILNTVKALRKEVPAEKAVLGFAGAPFTLLAYLLEGKLTKDLGIMKKWMATEPSIVHEWLSYLTESIATYLEAQATSGADAVQLFDTWAGVLTPEDYEIFALPYARRVLSEVTVPTIYYVNGVAGLIPQLNSVGAQALSVDWRVSLKTARAEVSPIVAIQGNLDPYHLHLPKALLREKVLRLCADYGTGPGHIFNLGHGMVPGLPEDGVRVVIEAVREWSASNL